MVSNGDDTCSVSRKLVASVSVTTFCAFVGVCVVGVFVVDVYVVACVASYAFSFFFVVFFYVF